MSKPLDTADPDVADGPTYWLVPAARSGAPDGDETLSRWLARDRWGIRAGRSLRAGDWIAFYVSGVGVSACARVSADVTHPLTADDIPDGVKMDWNLWCVELADAHRVIPPVQLTKELLVQLDIVRGTRALANWGWLVQTKRRISEADFSRLTIAGL